MATGTQPFTGNSGVTTLEAIMNQKPVPPPKVNPGLPSDLEGIIGRAMEKDRGKRYQSAEAMKADLQALKKETESGLTKTGRREGLPYRIVTDTFQTSSKPQRYLLLAVTALLITVLVSVGAWWVKHRMGGAGVAQRTLSL